ncbi:MAG: hypothetical protein JNL97_13440, partial [Verrucomicrobiales bacterium]|nr:hypothetical protein [Verrucomicrobiales bacterium]
RVEFIANGSIVATAVAPPYRARVTVRTSGSYSFAARATDDKDGKATSPELAATVTGPSTAPTLDVKSNLQVWLSADSGVIATPDGRVNSWFDQAGKGNDASQGDATFSPAFVDDAGGGLPAVRFDGTDDYLEIPDNDSVSIAGDITSLFVVKMDDFGTFRSVWAKTQANQPAPNDYYLLPGSGIPRLYRGNAQGSLGFVDGGAALKAGAFQIAGFASTQSNIVHVLNGVVTGRGVINASPADLDTPLKIGTRDDFVTVLKGDLAELLIYDAGLSSDDLDKVQLYLGEKYKIGILVPTNSAPTVAITSPAPGASFASPITVDVAATAADADGAVSRVEFLVNGAVAATDATAPFAASVTFPTVDEAVLTAVAYDNFGVRTVSDPVAITVTAPNPVPLPKPGRLKLWLKADAGVTAEGGAVGVWEDQSGNLNHAGQSDTAQRPQLVASAVNGRPALRFDGENDALAVPHSLGLAMVGDLTTYFVVKFDDFDTFRAVWAKTDGNQPRATDFYVVPTTGIPRALRGGAGGGSVDGTTALVAGEYAIVGFDMAGSTLRHWLNGTANGEGSISGAFIDTGKPLRIGTRDDGVTRLRGELAELLIYNASLGDADRAAVVSYLGNKYAIGVPAGPPQLTVARVAGEARINLSWPASASDYVLQSTDRIPGGSWQAVPGVTGTSTSLAIGPGNTYFRLAKP